MKYLFYFLFGLVLLSTSNAQTKYFIYFKDKGVASTAKLEKTSSLYKLAEQELTPKAIERRKEVMGDNYITYEDLPLNRDYVDQISRLGIKIENQLKWFNAVTSYLAPEQLKQIKNLPFVQRVEPVKVFYSNRDESNISFQSQPINSLKKTSYSIDYGPSLTENALSDIPVVHDLGIKGTNVYVGILDDGFSYSLYPALKNLKVIREYDYVHHLPNVSNQSGHGSSVFCLMAGFDPGNAIGPAYDAKFFLAETENDASETHVEEDNYAAALQDMESAGVDITSSSLGYNIFDPGQGSYTYADMNGTTTVVAKAANLAFQRGVTSFTAAGNDGVTFWGPGNGGLSSPGDAINIITVGAVTSNNVIANFSSRGPTSDGRLKPEVVAMGQGNYVASFNGTGYGYGSGTSYATPIAAGIGALLKSVYPHLTNRQIRKTFIECGDRVSLPDNNYGYGLISAKRVVTYPNLKQEGSTFRLYKIFIDPNGINPSTVQLNYKVNRSSYQTVFMTYDGALKYNFVFPGASMLDSIKFFFKYLANNGQSIRQPKVGAFVFSYWDLLIHYDSTQSIENNIPTQFHLMQNYPNPFNPSTTIEYQIPSSSNVTLKVFDILGREVETLVNGFQPAGDYHVTFGTAHSSLSSGVYFYTLKAGDFVQTKKLVLLK